MSAAAKRVALVTGSNQGIGFHIVKQLAARDPQLTVLLGARDASKGQAAVKELNAPNVQPITIDIDDQASITQAAEKVKSDFGGLDILVNNAGMAVRGDAFDEDVVKRTFKTNYYGTLHATQTFLPLIRPNGKIINVSSASSVSALNNMSAEVRAKFLDENITLDGLTRELEAFRAAVAKGDWKERGYPKSGYGMSKVGVSIMTRVLAKEMKNGITINCGCPGYCRTSMTNAGAPRSAEDGAKTFSHIAFLPAEGCPNGEFWEDEKVSSLTRPSKN